MKQIALFIVAPFCSLTAAVGFADNLLANEVAFAEHAVTVQLHKDGAPEKIVKQESDFLSRAEAAIKGKVASALGHGPSFLAHQAQSGAQATQALAAKVTREVEFATKAVGVQLEQDHAPAYLVQEEKGLLTKAEAAARNAEHMLGKLASMKGRKHSMAQHSAVQQSSRFGVDSAKYAKESSKTDTRLLDSVAVQEARILADERGQMGDLQAIESETKKALQEIHASSETEQNVNNLLSELKEDNRKLVNVEEQDLRNTKVLRNLRHIPQAVSHSTEELANIVSSENQKIAEQKDLLNLRHISHSTEELEKIVNSENQETAKIQTTTPASVPHLERLTPSSPNEAARIRSNTMNFAHAQHSINEEFGKLKSLEAQSNKLHAENARLKKEHAALEKNLELHLSNENAALALQNNELENENEDLKHKLKGTM